MTCNLEEISLNSPILFQFWLSFGLYLESRLCYLKTCVLLEACRYFQAGIFGYLAIVFILHKFNMFS